MADLRRDDLDAVIAALNDDEDSDGEGDEDGDGTGDGIVPDLSDDPAVDAVRWKRPMVEPGEPHAGDLRPWLVLNWIQEEELKRLGSSSLGQVMALISPHRRDAIIQHIISGEGTIDSIVEQYRVDWTMFDPDSLPEGAARLEAVKQRIKTVLSKRDPWMVEAAVVHLETLGALLTTALREAGRTPSSQWLLHRENYYVSLLLPLLSVQRLQDAAPPDVLRRLGRRTSVIQCCGQDAKQLKRGGADSLSLLNLNCAVLFIVFICMPPLLDQVGISPRMIDAVCRSLGHMHAWLLGWWVWCKRCRKWIWVWNLTGRRLADFRSTHSAVINNPIALNLPFIYSLLRGMSLVASRRGHDEVSVTKRLGHPKRQGNEKDGRRGLGGLPLKPQLFPTAGRTSTGKLFLGYTLRIDTGEQLVTTTLSEDFTAPRNQLQLHTPRVAAAKTVGDELQPTGLLQFCAYPSHIAMWALCCWSPSLSRPVVELQAPGADLNDAADLLVPLTLAVTSSSAARDGKYSALPLAHELALQEYWAQQQTLYIIEKAKARAAAQMLPPVASPPP